MTLGGQTILSRNLLATRNLTWNAKAYHGVIFTTICLMPEHLWASEVSDRSRSTVILGHGGALAVILDGLLLSRPSTSLGSPPERERLFEYILPVSLGSG